MADRLAMLRRVAVGFGMVSAGAAAFCAATASTTAPTTAQTFAPPHLGQPLSPADVARLDTSVFPDGRGLPQGRGSVAEGEPIYRSQCASCHGAGGIGGTAPELAGGTGALNSADPDQTIGLYWPYATTLFDFTRRSMPMGAPWSLTPDQTYAITAYLLHLNGIVGPDTVLDAATLPAIHMPNRDGFDPIDAPPPRRQQHR